MNSDLPSRVRGLFHEALELPPSERKAFLDKACADERELHAEVSQLLDLYADVEAADLPGEGCRSASASAVTVEKAGPSSGTAKHGDPRHADNFVGRRVGAYEVVQLIGAGGMGRVYLGRRADGAFTKDVAIKIIDPGRADEELVRRFKHEREILSALRHPHIAQLLDAGRTDDGQQYLVMEYVNGVPIRDFCFKNDVPLHDRLTMFLKVCDAVSEAHRHLIVHRDLKPGNILVEMSGAPRLVDFGIAKTVTSPDSETTDPTRPLKRRATPAYASPEQMRGGSAHTSMDIFALGVVLHELVTGHRPWPVDDDKGTLGSGRAYTLPSVGLARHLGVPPGRAWRKMPQISAHGAPKGLRPSDLEGDLDAILLRALESDPRRRYLDVDGLSNDVRAYLSNEPVSARPFSWHDRAQKFVRRKPALAAVTALAAVAVLVAAGTVTLLWLRAARERDHNAAELRHAKSLAASIFDLDRTLAGLPGSLAARRTLTESIGLYLANVQVGDDRDLALDTAESYRRLGDILGNPNGSNLGEPVRAIKNYQAALALLDPRYAASKQDDAVTMALARTHASLADVLQAQESIEEATTHYTRALALATEASLVPGDAVARGALLAGIRRPIGDLKLKAGDVAGALEEFNQAFAIDMESARRHPGDEELQRRLALTRARIATAHKEQGRFADARVGYQQAVEILKRLSDTGRVPTNVLRDIAVSRIHLGDALEESGDQAGRAEIQQAIEDLRAIAASDQDDVQSRRDLAAALVALGDVLVFESTAAARKAYLEARQVAASLTVGVDAGPRASSDLAIVDHRLNALTIGAPADLRLFRIVGKRRVPLEPGNPAPVENASLAVMTRATEGWSCYLLVFGANGPARLISDEELTRQGGTVSLTGPAPSQTVLLLTLPRPLTDVEHQSLLKDVDAIQGPRLVDGDAQILWSLDSETIDSTLSARGVAPLPWVHAVRDRIRKFGTVGLAGRTFPLKVSTR